MANNWPAYYRHLNLEDHLGSLWGQSEFLAAIVRLKPRRVLEVGAGSGSLSIALSQLGLEVTALDRDAEIVGLIRANNHKFGGRIGQILIGDSFHLPFPDDRFDLVFHQGVFEHYGDEEIVRLLREQLRVAPRVFFSVPNKSYPRRDFGDERLLSGRQWQKILLPFRVVINSAYSPKVFPKWFLPRARIQQMILVERQ